ncbi:MAG: flagellar biosynthetic protein FliO [Myxococcaceae bacterium]|nr:flagellar biosynthetic protein FliO [Myxococcaceae bacterium]
MTSLILALALSAQPPSAPSSADDVVAKAFADGSTPVAMNRAAPEPSMLGRVVGWGLALAAVGAVVIMAARRRQQKPEAGFAEIAQNLTVGPKRSLLVVNFAGQRLLVGATEGGFSVLSSQPMGPTEFEALVKEAAP